MNKEIAESLNKIEMLANGMYQIPSSEQNIGNIQSAIHAALLEIKRCLEVLAKEREKLCS